MICRNRAAVLDSEGSGFFAAGENYGGGDAAYREQSSQETGNG